MPVMRFTPVVQYLGKNLYSATCPEFRDCHAVADSMEAACRALERSIEKHLRKEPGDLQNQRNEGEPDEPH
jgi:predicted RNase H-like HicB family nuclease